MKRKGASLINVMVFMLFSAVVMAQVFFFVNNSLESVADEHLIMNYRLRLSELVEYAKDDLKKADARFTKGAISHDTKLDNKSLDFAAFYEATQARYTTTSSTYPLVSWDHPSSISNLDWNSRYKDKYYIRIHDLDYSFDASGFDSNKRNKWISEYSMEKSNMHKKLFAAMLPLGELLRNKSNDIVLDSIGKPRYASEYNRFYLIRAYAQLPNDDKFFGRKLMYQVLISRDEDKDNPANYHRIQTLSHQEVWF